MAASILMPAAHAQHPGDVLDVQIIPATIEGARPGMRVGYGSKWLQIYAIYLPTKENSGKFHSSAGASSPPPRASSRYLPAQGDRLGATDVLIDGVNGLEITATLHQNLPATFSMRAGAAWMSITECEQVVRQVILGDGCAKRGVSDGGFVGGDAVKTSFKITPTIAFIYKKLSISYNAYYGMGIGIQARW